ELARRSRRRRARVRSNRANLDGQQAAAGRMMRPRGFLHGRSMAMSSVSALPARAGVSFKPAHFRDIVAAAQPVGFFEVHAENYMGAGGPPHAQLAALRERYALSLHV